MKIIITEKQYILLTEGLKNTFWEDSDGNRVTLNQLLKLTKNLPIERISIKELKPHLINWDGDEKEMERVDDVNLSYPILIFINQEGEIKSILDGHHRIHKAIKKGLKTIKAKLIKMELLPKEIKKIFKHIK